jgi:Ni,Fe-hydrogenase III large subunit
MAAARLLSTSNGRAEPLSGVPVLPVGDFLSLVASGVRDGWGLAALFAVKGASRENAIFAVLADPQTGQIHLCSTQVGSSYPSLTPSCPAAHWFEREIHERWGILPAGHPWLKPVRRRADGTEFFRVEGEEVHEVAVGPVHAGVIEPGHFRFQCSGETVLHLEISLGYQHRGAARLLLAGPGPRALAVAETVAGDTSVGHATAYCQAMEALGGSRVPARASAIRAVGLELERAANHIGDLGALAGDVGFLPTASWCGRIRGDALNMSASLCGSRFGRGLVRPGGAGFGIDDGLAADLLARVGRLERDARGACELAWKAPSVAARYEGTGSVSAETAREIGLVGPAARACGIGRDVRSDFPTGIYRFTLVPPSTWHSGDVFGRAYVRWLETQRSLAFISESLRSLPAGETLTPPGAPAPGMIAVSLVEGWRGQICHVAATDGAGRLSLYEVVDPSFHNWFGLALAMRGGAISDFPLCNKSFNLSYCGHDL